jgi:hypothetical protein
MWCLLALVGAGCAAHGVAHVTPDESRPHVSWEIRSGADIGQTDFVCGSPQPSKPCELTASTDKSGTLATLRLFVHPSVEPTSYLGFMRVPFVDGAPDRKLGEVNATVPPGGRPVGTTVTGRVTTKPGSYGLTVSVDAIQPDMAAPQRIAHEIPVIVK